MRRVIQLKWRGPTCFGTSDRGTHETQRPTHVIMVATYVLVPYSHQTINRHHIDLSTRIILHTKHIPLRSLENNFIKEVGRAAAHWHQMETISALQALCAGNSLVTGEFPAQGPVTRSVDVSFDLRLNKRLSEQSWCRWFQAPSRSLWRHCDVYLILTGLSPRDDNALRIISPGLRGLSIILFSTIRQTPPKHYSTGETNSAINKPQPRPGWDDQLLSMICISSALFQYPRRRFITMNSRYIAFICNTIIPTEQQLQWYGQTLHSRTTPHISPSCAIYGVSFVKCLKKHDRDISRAHCIRFRKASQPRNWVLKCPVLLRSQPNVMII